MASRAPEIQPTMTAGQLLARVRRKGGRVYRMREFAVFVLTDDEELARWMISRGGKRFTPQNADPSTPAGSYRRAPGGKLEWDIYIHAIPVLGQRTVWEAAARDGQIENAEDAA